MINTIETVLDYIVLIMLPFATFKITTTPDEDTLANTP